MKDFGTNKIIVKGAYGVTNFGDDALMKVIYDEFIQNKENVTFSSLKNDYLKKIAPLASFTVLKNITEEYDFIIYGGGTQFYSFKPKAKIYSKIFNYILKPKLVINKLLKIFKKKEKQMLKKQMIGAIGIGLGPFLTGSDPKIERSTKALFNKMDFICIRDNYSNNKCLEWGIKEFHHFTDICYGSNHDKFLKPIKYNKISTIGVVVRDWVHTEEGSAYTNELIETVEQLRLDNFKVVFIVFAKARDTQWMRLLNLNKEKAIIWDPYKNSIDNFIDELSSFDLFITARYHGAIYATLLGKPFISIEVEQKLNMINEIFNEGSDVWKYPFIKEKLINKVKKIDNNYSFYLKNIENTTREQMKKGNLMKKEFIKFIQNNSL